ncbi:molybdate ABC transporter substrate-binding protein [Profundibacter sp.]
MKFFASLIVTVLWFGLTGAARAGEVTVAVASNFLTTVHKIADGFTARTGHSVRIVNGSTGTLYAQISIGAPYDVFLSADQERVLLLADADKLLGDAHKPYALGRLILYARGGGVLAEDIQHSLAPASVHHFAMADPKLAPYGRAAFEVLSHLGLTDMIKQKAVLGANIGQTFGFVKTGNAVVGFVALSQAVEVGGDWLDIPASYYAPIIQEAGLLKHAKGNAAARAFYDHLSSNAVMDILQTSGYGAAE